MIKVKNIYVVILSSFIALTLIGCGGGVVAVGTDPAKAINSQEVGDTLCGIFVDLKTEINEPGLFTKDELEKIAEAVPMISMVCKDDGSFQPLALQDLISKGLPLVRNVVVDSTSLTPQGKAILKITLSSIERRAKNILKQQALAVPTTTSISK